MPIVKSLYRPKGLFRNAHFSTIYSAKLRRTPGLQQERERIILSDGDFIDLDFSFSRTATSRIAILLHGLEGNAQRSYMKGQADLLVKNGWDVCAVNYRGCSGEPNKLYRSYNAGTTDDLAEIVDHLLQKDTYTAITLIGFSLGGNLLLKYLGEGRQLPKEIKKAVAVSTPLRLDGSLEQLNKYHNWIYRTSFLFDLKRKYRQKVTRFPSETSQSYKRRIGTLLEFDTVYTAPAHGYTDAYDYYEKNSSLQFLPQIAVPVLILNATNDSFLSPKCFPADFAARSKDIFLEVPAWGGHVGFYERGDHFYSEKRALEFLDKS